MPKKAASTEPTEGKLSMLAAVVAKLNKEFGSGVVRLGSDDYLKVDRIPTGSYVLDFITGGGIPRGRITEIYGQYSACKTYLAWQIVVQIQKMFTGVVLYVNLEDTFDSEHVQRIGVDLSRVVVMRPNVAEDAVNMTYAALKEGVFDAIIVDSIAALLPKAEAEADAEKDQMGRMGKLTSAMMRKMVNGNTNKTTIILINQERDKLGVMWGEKSAPTGGRAIPYYASQRIQMRRGKALKTKKGGEDVFMGREVHIKLEKDKVGPNEQLTTKTIYLVKRRRFDLEEELLTVGGLLGAVRKVKGGVTVLDHSFRGRDAAKAGLRDDKALRKALTKVIKTAIADPERKTA
jgi:recombination protein RecA